jgi:hypothetical protein
MRVDDRDTSLSIASSKFGVDWAGSIGRQIKTYADAAYVMNQVDGFWINAARKKLKTEAALKEWSAFDTTSLDLGPAIKMTGDLVAGLVKEYDLSFGEISSLLSTNRSQDAKYLIRAERKHSKSHSNSLG